MNTKDLVTIAMFATLLSVCAWIYIPMTIPFTMQTFAVFLAMIVLGGRKGTLVIGIYMLLGILGVPVFAGGSAGIGVVFGATGGYMIGWLILGLVVWASEKLIRNKKLTDNEKLDGNHKYAQVAAMVAGLILCYLFGTWWFQNIYMKNSGDSSFRSVFGVCVLPFVIPDIVKMILAFSVGKRLRRIMKNV